MKFYLLQYESLNLKDGKTNRFEFNKIFPTFVDKWKEKINFIRGFP